MLASAYLESVVVGLSVVAPLVTAPLAALTFYLRSLREHQVQRHQEVVRRLESTESSLIELRREIAQFEREYTTKEEWLREYLHTRRLVEQLTTASTRIETNLRNVLWVLDRTRERDGAPAPGEAGDDGATRSASQDDDWQPSERQEVCSNRIDNEELE
jgi:hypothetical protein